MDAKQWAAKFLKEVPQTTAGINDLHEWRLVAFGYFMGSGLSVLDAFRTAMEIVPGDVRERRSGRHAEET